MKSKVIMLLFLISIINMKASKLVFTNKKRQNIIKQMKNLLNM